MAFMPGLDLASLTSCSSLSWTSTKRAQDGRRKLVGGSAGLLLGKLKTASAPWRSLASSPLADFICLRISLATSGGAALAMSAGMITLGLPKTDGAGSLL